MIMYVVEPFLESLQSNSLFPVFVLKYDVLTLRYFTLTYLR